MWLAILKILLVIVSLALIGVVLMQSGRSAGLSGAIAGGAEQLVGRKARGIDAVLMKATTILGTVFFIVALVVAWLIARGS
ncbi:preprotein translocase subunit SecG [Kyrpidia spormannii]|uniref:Protein-export membrane protein SecG n=2 Tax=Kyrpidia spormannii TaxID=2055160 RepID=A0A2K8N3B3_9BACL|nr:MULTISPECIES: preprotein translocase subunit SecG [Kyrpidia]ATY83991.1 preprotein translocase subunit SecG [Kyrpidia spormannii]MCL6576611.1 preprotein translocase subunit SecG [Kyrpidia sp.]CAB3389938.1 preprotein translocase subunit [Kyrpidia spormannii]CAB3390838.1 preprotein translocase subunit [Kyrpidia spormannii]